MTQTNLFHQVPKVGDIVESIHGGGKIKVEKVYESFITGREVNFFQTHHWFKETDFRILSFENIKN